MKKKQNRQNILDENNDMGRFFELATSDKIYVNSSNLHGIKNEILLDYTSDFVLKRLKIIGLIEHKTNIRSKNMDDFESYLNGVDIDSVSDVSTFTGHVYNLKTPKFLVVKRSAYTKGTNFMQKLVEYHGKTSHLPI